MPSNLMTSYDGPGPGPSPGKHPQTRVLILAVEETSFYLQYLDSDVFMMLHSNKVLTSAGERERASWETLLLGKETCKIPTCHSLRIYDNSNLREMTLSI